MLLFFQFFEYFLDRGGPGEEIVIPGLPIAKGVSRSKWRSVAGVSWKRQSREKLPPAPTLLGGKLSLADVFVPMIVTARFEPSQNRRASGGLDLGGEIFG